jgi:hypothetical protein
VNDVRTNEATGTAEVLVNFAAFQIGWLACVLSAAKGSPWIGTAVAVIVIAVRAWRAARPAPELWLVALTVAIGLVWDSLLINLGLIAFSSGILVDQAAPHWILALWALFATTLNVSLRWLHKRWAVAVLLGAVAGPLSYWGGARMGALVLLDPTRALLALAVGWAVMTPLLLTLARRYDGVAPAQ